MKRELPFILLALGATAMSLGAQEQHTLRTRWAAEVTPENAWPEYPRPQMARKEWQNLNGLWSYAIKGKGGSDWSYSWVPILGPLVGAAAAALLYRAIS